MRWRMDARSGSGGGGSSSDGAAAEGAGGVGVEPVVDAVDVEDVLAGGHLQQLLLHFKLPQANTAPVIEIPIGKCELLAKCGTIVILIIELPLMRWNSKWAYNIYTHMLRYLFLRIDHESYIFLPIIRIGRCTIFLYMNHKFPCVC